MSHSKPLLIPWLRTQIDSGRYPGVQWTNPAQTEFCIPWKHALRQDSSDADVLIFKAWAETSVGGRAQGDAAVWKRNFRSALRIKGFKLVCDKKNDNADPHKVFGWPDESSPAANSSAGYRKQDEADLFAGIGFPTQEVSSYLDDCLYLPEESGFTASGTSQDILQQCLQELNIGPETEGTAGFEPPPEQQQPHGRGPIGGCALPGQQPYPVKFEGAVREAELPEQPTHPMEGAVGGACGGQSAEQFLHTMNKAREGDSLNTQFRVSVFYRGVKVSERLVENEAGIRLVYRPELIGPVLDPESGLSLFSLPSPGVMLDQTQAGLTRRILDKLGDGFDLGVSGHVVFGQRRSEIRVFWSVSKFDQSQQPREISKLQPQKLYELKDFVRGILEFIGGRESPPCSLFFCLGEKWPDPDNRPWSKKLITVEVVLTTMELLKTLAVEGGASSLQSVELQMSLEEMMETC